ncbi:MAG: ImmA/IrrE family metallo-endopeptidase [Hydrogenibacillus schlegelii]|uniref:ImmA/IrrE family metallo-endopeptidase n=1 Tax=Hydrogenibacillus schlegelii TaxID=1484 RepID=A0A947CVY4_HYDSH|nr:ImmA/IrrE family metallo-endopeptidase [Hydrogenibacillus schlegelii]
MYCPTPLEAFILDVYAALGITGPEELEIGPVAGHFGLRLMLADVGSRRVGSWIVLDRRLPADRRREDFFHELVHAVLDSGNQLQDPRLRVAFQEGRADRAAMEWAAPGPWLLERLDPDRPYADQVPALAGAFRLSRAFMARRLYHLWRRVEAIRLGALK